VTGDISKADQKLKWLGLLALVAMWGSAFAVMNIAVKEVPPFWMAAGRLWVGAIFVGSVLLVRREKLPSPASAPLAWRTYIVVGLFGTALPFILFAWGSAHTQSALLGISNGAVPVFTALLTALFVPAEIMTVRRWLGVALGFCGLVVLVGPEALRALNTLGASESSFMGIAAGVAGAFCYACANIVTKRAPPMSANAAAVIFCLTGALGCTLVAMWSAPLPESISLKAVLCILALGIFPTGFASILYVWIVRTHGPVFSSLATYITPLWATVIGVVFLDEHLGLNAFAALALIILGVFVASRVSPPHEAR
jgi:drug/metabolite transporter (DMT)-like permease